MKKNLLVFAAACFFTFQTMGQYNSIWAGYPMGYELSSGFATQNTPGYFWLGYLPDVQQINTTWHTNKNFCILGTGMSSIWASYKVFESSGCNGQLTPVLNGNGVSAIETKGPGNLSYALAGVYDKACYFTTLDKFGNVLKAVSYPFPGQVSLQFSPPSKPVLVESSHSGEYFISGYFESYLYVINIDANGKVIWSDFYTLGKDFRPRDIIMNPNMPDEVVIVGEVSMFSGDSQGFYLGINGNSGMINTARIFGTAETTDGFGCITVVDAANAPNDKGFVIGGYTTKVQGNKGVTSWVLKVDIKGNLVWSSVPDPSKGSNKGVIDIVERLNTFGNYEYYALLDSDAGMQVLKLDSQGAPFPISSPNALHNEFIYDLPSQNSSHATSISYVNSPANTVNVGIQVFGTASNFSGFSSSYVVSAYFNGETNCYRTLTQIKDVDKGPMLTEDVLLKPFGSFSSCYNFQVVAFFPGGSLNYPCYFPSNAGSNQRSMPSGIDPAEVLNENFSVYPNPAADKALVNYSVADNSDVQIDLYNLLGQQLLHITPEARLAGTYSQEIDFSALNVPRGAYFVTTTVDGKVHKQKIIYTK